MKYIIFSFFILFFNVLHAEDVEKNLNFKLRNNIDLTIVVKDDTTYFHPTSLSSHFYTWNRYTYSLNKKNIEDIFKYYESIIKSEKDFYVNSLHIIEEPEKYRKINFYIKIGNDKIHGASSENNWSRILPTQSSINKMSSDNNYFNIDFFDFHDTFQNSAQRLYDNGGELVLDFEWLDQFENKIDNRTVVLTLSPGDSLDTNLIEHKLKKQFDQEMSDIYIKFSLIGLGSIFILFLVIKIIFRIAYKLKNTTKTIANKLDERNIRRVAEEAVVKETIKKSINNADDDQIRLLKESISEAIRNGDSKKAQEFMDILERIKQ